MKVSRIDLADFGSPERLVQGILTQVPDMPIPVPVEELAQQLDIIGIEELETDAFEGGLLTERDKANGIILVNRASGHRRRRFTIGHELGHFLCPSHLPKDDDGFRCTPADMRRASASNSDRAAQMEVEANRFAALLLLPQAQFRKDMNCRPSANIQHIIELANRYDVSKEATARRYVDLHDEPCAAVISQNGQILRCYRGAGFPFIGPGKGDPVPAGSITTRGGLAHGVVSDLEEVDAALWVPSDRGRRTPVLYEQTHQQREGFRLTLLTIDSAREEQADEEEEMEESWRVRFPRRR